MRREGYKEKEVQGDLLNPPSSLCLLPFHLLPFSLLACLLLFLLPSLSFNPSSP
eukprot:m.152033 g.152033  ORF g.152033 m.152033 type:complete len:54 (+) comp16206_c1_seq1:69-230(+)